MDAPGSVELCGEKERTIYEERDKGRFKPCVLEEDGKALGMLSSGFSRVLTWSGTGVDSVAYCFNPQEKCEKKISRFARQYI